MKKSAVRPVGVLGPHRQRQVLDGLKKRLMICQQELRDLEKNHQLELSANEEELGGLRESVVSECRSRRREVLHDWDLQQEAFLSGYENQVVEQRNHLSRLSILYRRKLDEATSSIEKKAKQRQKAAEQKNAHSKKELLSKRHQQSRQVKEFREKYSQHFEQIQSLVLRRLDRLPSLPQRDSAHCDDKTLTIHSDSDLTNYFNKSLNQIESYRHQLIGTKIAKITESWFLPIIGLTLALFWMVMSLTVWKAPIDFPPVVWALGGIVVSGVVAFIAYVTCMFPLKRQTLSLYPALQELGSDFNHVLATYEKWIATKFEAEEKELNSSHQVAVADITRSRDQSLERLKNQLENDQAIERKSIQDALDDQDAKFSRQFHEIDHRMRGKAEGLASEISKAIETTDQNIKNRRESLLSQHASETFRLKNRMRLGFQGVNRKFAEANKQAEYQVPDWEQVSAGRSTGHQQVDYLTLGRLQIGSWVDSISQAMKASGGEESRRGTTDELIVDDSGFGIPQFFPLVLHRRLHSGIFLTVDEALVPKAVEFVHQILWQVLSSVEPSKAKLILMDPLGRGQHFTNFMALTDYDPDLVGHRVWTTEEMIEKRLGELAHHSEEILLTCLRDRFARIEDYNQVAGALAEPYTCVAAIGLPLGVTRASYRHLNALIENGSRCGNLVIIVSDRSNQWPTDMPALRQSKMLHLDLSESDGYRVKSSQLDEFTFSPTMGPSSEQRSKIMEVVGKRSVAASKVEVPLSQLIDEGDDRFGCTDDGIAITLGTQGAGRPLSLAIGEGVKQHVLIAGKTGSGKSTLLHTLITAGALKYRPDQLNYYLLDFKKGVEFKSYADEALPHARVIGIESEREFGRSVLQRLDLELKERGEAFRQCGAQSLARYRSATQKTLPRIVLVIDEFQELFVRDDRLASECTMLLDRIVRQGRSFGLHVVLSSQSLAGAYSLPRATLGQMAIRIAMQCSESDAALILSDENTAAKLIKRPGEAIYNDAGGLLEGNQPFQAAWVSPDEHHRMLRKITSRDNKFERLFSPRVIFEGNRPSKWNTDLADEAIAAHGDSAISALVGQSVEIGPPVTVHFREEPGRNLLLVAGEEVRQSTQTSLLISLLKSQPSSQILVFEGHRSRSQSATWDQLDLSDFDLSIVKPRECEQAILDVEQSMKDRASAENSCPPMFVFIDPLERFRELRQEEGFSFSLGSANDKSSASVAFQNVLRDGPSVNIFVVVGCASVETLTRWLPRASHRDLELRLLGQMNASDSAFLIDSSDASNLTAATLLFYDDASGTAQKCRVLGHPDVNELSSWLSVDRL
jgi:S-DNA-T family DNA segregation ATPase FtsK/SpoIIIE